MGNIHAGRCMEGCSHAIAESDGSCFVEQQHIYIACGFYCAATCRQHIAAYQPVHTAYADGAQQPADSRWDKAYQQRNEYGQRGCCRHQAGFCFAVSGKCFERSHSQKKHDSKPGQQNSKSDFIWRFLPACAFHQRDHCIDKGAARIGGNADNNAVADHAGTTCNSTAVAAAFAHNGS